MGARATVAAICLLAGLSFTNGAERNVTHAYGQTIRTDKLLERWNLRETYREDLGCVEGTFIDIPHVSGNDADTQFVSLPMGTFFRWRYFHSTPSSAFMDFGRGKGIIKRVTANSPLTRQTGFRRIYCIGDDGFKPFIFIGDFAKVSPRNPIDNVLSGSPTDIPSPQFNEKSQIVAFRKAIWRQNFNRAVEGRLNCEPWPQVPSGNLLGVSKCFSAFLDSSFSGLCANTGRFGCNSSVVQRANYKDYPESTDQARYPSPKSLIFGRYSSTPCYAKFCAGARLLPHLAA